MRSFVISFDQSVIHSSIGYLMWTAWCLHEEWVVWVSVWGFYSSIDITSTSSGSDTYIDITSIGSDTCIDVMSTSTGSDVLLGNIVNRKCPWLDNVENGRTGVVAHSSSITQHWMCAYANLVFWLGSYGSSLFLTPELVQKILGNRSGISKNSNCSG